MIIQNTGNNTTGGFLVFSLEKGAAGADDDLPGYISWQSVSDTQRQLTFGTIYTQVSDATDGEGAGDMHLQVASYDGTLRSGLYLNGDTNAAGEVDVTIAAGAASKTTITGDLAVGGDDVTIYNAVNDSNPTISLGSAAANRFEIKTAYNSGAQTLDEVYFSTYTTSGSTNDGRYIWEVDEVELMRLLDDGLNVVDGYINAAGTDAFLATRNSNASSATEGGRLKLICDDGAAMADDHRLGVIEFSGAEDGDANRQTGARIQAMCDAAWSASENGTRLEFYTMDGNAASELSLTLDSDKLATFAGGVTVDGTITGDVTGALTGQADTVSTITGLAPNTATTQATQAAITTCANLVTVGTIGTGVWNGTKVTDVYTNSSGKRHGSTIKILPSDFMINDDVASPLSFKDGSNSGVHVNDASSEVIAFITIPEGMKATLVDVYGTHNKTLKVWEVNVHESFDFTGSTIGTGSMNTQLDITDTDSTADNYLAIQITLTATSQRIWGGRVTIAAQ